jgi:hypothetical protein
MEAIAFKESAAPHMAQRTWTIVERQLANAVVRRLQTRLNDRQREQIVDAYDKVQSAQAELRNAVDDIVDYLFNKGY